MKHSGFFQGLVKHTVTHFRLYIEICIAISFDLNSGKALGSYLVVYFVTKMTRKDLHWTNLQQIFKVYLRFIYLFVYLYKVSY